MRHATPRRGAGPWSILVAVVLVMAGPGAVGAPAASEAGAGAGADVGADVGADAGASAAMAASATPRPTGASAPGVADDPRLDARVQALARELRCLVCQNESLADSQASLAVDLRREMRTLLAAGRRDDEVVAFLVDRYGDFVRYRPPLAPRTWLLWGGPALALVVGLGLLGRAVRHRQRADARPLAPLDDDERRRLAGLLGLEGGE